MAKPRGVARAEVIQRIKGAISGGLSASKFVTKMRAAGLGYRRTDMLNDWRTVNNIEKKTGILRNVRKDYFPSTSTYAKVTWRTSREYMYKVRVESRASPDKPITSRFVNIVSDKPMTPRELETEVQDSWAGWYPDRQGEIDTVTPETAMQRIT